MFLAVCATRVRTMSRTTLDLGSIVPSSTLNLLTNIPNTFSTTLLPPVVCYSLFPDELSSAVWFQKPWYQGKGFVTQKEVVQIWSSFPEGFRWWKYPRCYPRCFPHLSAINCASEEDPLDPTSTPMNLYSASTRASSTREKKPLHLEYSLPDLSGFFMAIWFLSSRAQHTLRMNSGLSL